MGEITKAGPNLEALDAAAHALEETPPESIRGNVSRRGARRKVDRFWAAWDEYCAAYKAELGKLPGYPLTVFYAGALARVAALETVSNRKTSGEKPMVEDINNEEIETLDLFWKAYRRARRAICRYTRPTEIKRRLAAYRAAWNSPNRGENFPLLFRSPRARAVGEYLMGLVDIALEGRISTTNPDFYRAFDEIFDAEERKLYQTFDDIFNSKEGKA